MSMLVPSTPNSAPSASVERSRADDARVIPTPMGATEIALTTKIQRHPSPLRSVRGAARVVRAPLASVLTLFLAFFVAFFLAFFALVAISRPALADEEADRSTPRRTMHLFIDEARAGRFDRAAMALDLPAARAAEGQTIARELKVVLDQKLWIVWETISDDPGGKPEDGAATDQIGTIPLGGAAVPIVLHRAPGPRGAPIWLVSRTTIDAVPQLYKAYGPGVLDQRIPPVLRDTRIMEMALWQWLGVLLAPILAWIGGVLLARIALGAAGRIARRTEADWDDQLLEKAKSPVRTLITLLLISALVAPLHLSVPAQNVVDRMLQTLFILSVAWLVTRVVKLTGEAVTARIIKRRGDGAESRGDKTRIAMLQRIVIAAIALVSSALVLLQFEVVRQVGVSLLASAGIAGVVLGFAAQKSIATLLAGIQLSMAESVRIGDTVIVEGEWGTITLTYVVVKIWDLRRLVVPITYFLEKPFQNWTKSSPELLGTVVVHADYTVPVEKVRAEVKRICESNDNWDGKSQGLIIVDATADTVILRALISAKDASKQWDLRVAMREGLVKFLQELDGGRYLPRSRVLLDEKLDKPG
jgi:small-conductance mechanosensitive channel